MQFTINRESLLKPLQLVTAVIERRQTLPILSNLFIDLQKQTLSLLGTDMEVELSGRVKLEQGSQEGKITAPARKLVDICRSLPEDSELKFQHKGDKLILQCGRSRFNLATLPATDFPVSELTAPSVTVSRFNLPQTQLCSLLKATHFAMAQQDVRYYLNGMLWELTQGKIRTVSTDGHRLALSQQSVDNDIDRQIIVPRKAIYELLRLLNEESEEKALIQLDDSQLRVMLQDYTFTSKLIDGKFPDYDRVIPLKSDKVLTIDRDVLKHSLLRVGVLTHDKHRSVSLEMKDNNLRIFANNLSHEEAEDHLDVNYTGTAVAIAFNINYLMDVLNSLPAGLVKISLTSADASVRLESAEEDSSVYVIMPMRL